MNKRLEKYIGIREDEKYQGKTRRWWVYSKSDGDLVGQVKWYGGWRKYVYYDLCEAGAFMDWDFMRMVASFCEEQTLVHYNKI